MVHAQAKGQEVGRERKRHVDRTLRSGEVGPRVLGAGRGLVALQEGDDGRIRNTNDPVDGELSSESDVRVALRSGNSGAEVEVVGLRGLVDGVDAVARNSVLTDGDEETAVLGEQRGAAIRVQNAIHNGDRHLIAQHDFVRVLGCERRRVGRVVHLVGVGDVGQVIVVNGAACGRSFFFFTKYLIYSVGDSQLFARYSYPQNGLPTTRYCPLFVSATL